MNKLLYTLIHAQKINNVAVIGMAKNVGKTVVLNHLIRAVAGTGARLGLTSIGRDGEEWDAVYRIPKPRIYAPAGSLVATAAASLHRSSAAVAVLEKTGCGTPLGEVLIGRVTGAGLVELAGAAFAGQQREIQEKLFGYGAELVLTDGALDRTNPALLSASEGVILATGAAAGAAIPDVVRRTRDRVERFSLPQLAGDEAELCRRVVAAGPGAVISNGEVAMLTARSLAAGEEIGKLIRAGSPNAAMVVLGGAVGDGVLGALGACPGEAGRLHLVVRSGAHLFASARVWRGFVKAGGRVSVIEPIKLLAVTVNPTAPTGPGFPAEKFLAVVGEAMAPLPVFDVVLGRSTLAD